MPSALVFAATGSKPSQVLQVCKYDEPRLAENLVLVRLLAAPINPLDLLVIAGQYPVKPKNTVDGKGVAGFDGVARVEQANTGTGLKVGDLVILNALGLGSWRTHAAIDASDLLPIPPVEDVVFASILKTAVLPAYFLLEDMRTLRPGDWVIQNGGTGVIAQMVVQLAHLRGVNVISVIRDRENMLQALHGVDVVIQEKALSNTNALQGKRIVLALDSVFGSSATAIANHLSDHSTFVNYGQLSGGGPSALMDVTHRHLFWQRLTFKSFRGTEQVALRSTTELRDLYAWFVRLFNEGKLKRPEMNVAEWEGQEDELQFKLRGVFEKVEEATVGTRKTVLVFNS